MSLAEDGIYSGDLDLFGEILSSARASLVAQMVKNQPEMQETQVQSLNWKDPLEKEMAGESPGEHITYSCILAWRIP